MRLGRHMPTGSKPVAALHTAREIGADAAQIFVTNPRGWRAPTSNPAQEDAFRHAIAETGEPPIVVHATYLINLASPRDEVFMPSVSLLRATLERAERFGASHVVFHIGSHGGAGEEAGIERLASGISRVLEGTPEDVRLLLENDVGGGGKLGYRFENLAAVLEQLAEQRERLGVCLDTAHLWGAGFDISTEEGVERTLAEADRVLGLTRVPVLHINDTPKGLGSHLDNHARIGEGVIGEQGISTVLRHPGLAHAIALLETPLPVQSEGVTDWIAERRFMQRAHELAGAPALEIAQEPLA